MGLEERLSLLEFRFRLVVFIGSVVFFKIFSLRRVKVLKLWVLFYSGAWGSFKGGIVGVESRRGYEDFLFRFCVVRVRFGVGLV